jgi:transcriptional regulator with XRE-family HTH domain
LKKRRDENILKLCGELIKKHRVEAGYTQEQFSEMLNMDTSQYGRIERGLTNVTLSTLSEIAEQLNVSVRSLLPD